MSIQAVQQAEAAIAEIDRRIEVQNSYIELVDESLQEANPGVSKEFLFERRRRFVLTIRELTAKRISAVAFRDIKMAEVKMSNHFLS